VNKKYILLAALFSFLVVSFSSNLAASNEKILVLRGARVLSPDGIFLKDCQVIIENGKIQAVGSSTKNPQGASTIDAQGKWLIPGLIDVFICPNKIAKEKSEKLDYFTPEHKILDILNPAKYPTIGSDGWEIYKIHTGKFKEALKSGITTLVVIPDQTRIVSGLAGIFKLKNLSMENSVLSDSFALKIGFDRKSTEGLKSHMGILWGIRELFLKAQVMSEENKDKEQNAAKQILSQVLSQNLPVLFETNTEEEVARALSLQQEFKLKSIFFGKLACPAAFEEISQAKIPILLALPSLAEVDNFLENFKKMRSQSLEVALFSSDNSLNPLKALISLRPWLEEAKITENEIYNLITINSAKIAGFSQKIGSIEKGRDADLILLNGNPLQPMTKVEKVFIEGRILYDLEEKKEE
jgi:imidazolonepropionase-like amidohydrolase